MARYSFVAPDGRELREFYNVDEAYAYRDALLRNGASFKFLGDGEEIVLGQIIPMQNEIQLATDWEIKNCDLDCSFPGHAQRCTCDECMKIYEQRKRERAEENRLMMAEIISMRYFSESELEPVRFSIFEKRFHQFVRFAVPIAVVIVIVMALLAK